MYKKTRTADRTFHGNSGDLEDYKVRIRKYLWGICYSDHEDKQTSTDAKDKNSIGFG